MTLKELAEQFGIPAHKVHPINGIEPPIESGVLWKLFHALKVLAYMQMKGYRIDTDPGHVNIVYIEGINPDFTLNSDTADGWNDLSIIITFDAEKIPKVAFSAVCTTEPGKAATFDSAARRLGGVARIALGQHTAWRVGFHKQSRLLDTHPALVQCAPVPVHRDSNRDGLRIGDPVGYAQGLNQHGTSPVYRGGAVGRWSAGCLVRQWWADHLRYHGDSPLRPALSVQPAVYFFDDDYCR